MSIFNYHRKKHKLRIGVVGRGFVGDSMYQSFVNKGLVEHDDLFSYDKYKNGGIGSIQDVINCDILFLCLPTNYNINMKAYNLTPIYETCRSLVQYSYSGLVVIKSTLEPETTSKLDREFETLDFVHNPEFLSAKTCYEDFENQKHVVLGRSPSCPDHKINRLKNFYNMYYPDAEVSISSSSESEMMKIGVNCFYSIKIQFFNELYLLCQKNNSDYNKVKDMMLKNDWINPMHTKVPGSDGSMSYGGLCFPKDTNALNEYMRRKDSPNKVLEATIEERNIMRGEDEDDNIEK